ISRMSSTEREPKGCKASKGLYDDYDLRHFLSWKPYARIVSGSRKMNGSGSPGGCSRFERSSCCELSWGRAGGSGNSLWCIRLYIAMSIINRGVVYSSHQLQGECPWLGHLP